MQVIGEWKVARKDRRGDARPVLGMKEITGTAFVLVADEDGVFKWWNLDDCMYMGPEKKGRFK